MKIRAYRIVQSKLLRGAFTGEGAARFPGRWNQRGNRVVYCSSSIALAALEILVNVGAADLLGSYSCFEVEFDSKLVQAAKPLPRNWRANPIPVSTRRLGHAWLIKMESAVLRVPSAVIPDESNFLLNPDHPEFPKIKIGKAEKFAWDERLRRLK